MSALQAALEEYLAAHRALGHKLRLSGRLLQRFVVFAESSGATFIATEIALAWAMHPAEAQPAQRANRLAMVRRFARYCSTSDPRTVVPPTAIRKVGRSARKCVRCPSICMSKPSCSKP